MMLATSFITDNIRLGWYDLLWGYRNKLIGWRTPVDMAKAGRVPGPADPSLVIELATINKDEDWKVSDILTALARDEKASEDESKRKWLYLTMLWIYQNREQIPNPFAKVEEVYADFDYPDEIRGIVPYMPPDDGYKPQEHTHEQNMMRLLDKWREYLSESHRVLVA